MQPTLQDQPTTKESGRKPVMKRWLLPLTGGLVALALLVGGYMLWQNMNQVAEEETPTASVSITESGFNPATIRVKKGQDVTWTNETSMPQSVMSDKTDGSAPQTEEPLATGDSYSFTFEESGTYDYRGDANSAHKGVVIVE